MRSLQSPNERSIRYTGWSVLAASFIGVMVSFAPIIPYTFRLFLDPLQAPGLLPSIAPAHRTNVNEYRLVISYSLMGFIRC